MFQLIQSNLARYVRLTDDELEIFTSLLSVVHLRKGEALLRAGETCVFEGFVNRGCLRVYNVDENGREQVLYFATEASWVVDMASFISQAPASLNIDALERSELLVIDKPSKERLCLQVPTFERLFRIMTQLSHASLQQRLVASMSRSADERYSQFRLRYAHLEERVPQHQIASYLGISPECLSRVRKRSSRIQ